MSISILGQKDIHRITSGQVIIDLPTVLKELIENSLDAHSTKIEINFNDSGLDSLEIVDNGDGIDPKDFEGIALNHHTSKLSNFDDIMRLKTLGFRGEAISSLCSTSSVLITTTNHPPKANKLEFSKTGELLKNTVCSRPRGTTVHISNLFENLPVRQKDLQKNIKREFAKTLSLISDYIIISEGVKFIVTNVTKKGKRQKLLNSQGSTLLKDNLLDIFGSNALFGLIPIEVQIDLNHRKTRMKVSDHTKDYSIEISGLISQSSFGFGRPINDRQFWYINKRPVNLPKFSKLINELYKGYNHLQFPSFVLNINMDTEYLDVNVTPDKRTILIHNETEILEEFRLKLVDFFDALDLSIPKNDFQRGVESFTSNNREIDGEIEVIKTDTLRKKGFAYSGVKKENESIIEEHEATEIEEDSPREYDNDPNVIYENGDDKNGETPINEGDADVEEEADRPEKADSHLSAKRMYDLEEISPSANRSKRSKLQDTTERYDDQEVAQDITDVQSESEPDADVVEEHRRPAVRQTPSRFSNRTKLTSLRDLASFRNGATSTSSTVQVSGKKKPRQMTLEPVIMKIGGNSIIHNAFVKGDTLNFENCHCGDEHPAGYNHEKEAENGSEGENESEGESDLREDEESENPDIDEETQISVPSTDKTDITDYHEPKLLHQKRTEMSLNYKTTVKLPSMFAQANLEPIVKSESKEDIKIDDIENIEESENLLALTVSKKDFQNMKIIGQFNLGFILVIRNGKDLFIIDQHASDEKFNFEDLQKNTIFQSQRLFKQEKIDLNSIDELIVLEHLDIFEKNGFHVLINEMEKPGSKISLSSLPISKKTIFGINDFNELIHLIKENPQNPNVRCSKIRSMFAMRACRKSIMVGKPLNMKTMVKVVRNLGKLEKPWNCPHGRPTMRHLMELNKWKPFNKDYTT